jgi:HK97 gp10 family phage protein
MSRGSTVTVKWYGAQLLAEIRGGTPDALLEGAQILVDAAASRAPRSSGDLAESGYVSVDGGKSTYKSDKKHNKEVKPPKGGAIAGFAAFYARFVEFGTSKMPARPYFRPAIDELKEQIGNAIFVKIKSNIK